MAELGLRERREGIEAPVEVAWEVLSDTNRYAEWVPETLEVIRTDGPASLGSTYTERTKIIGPITAKAEWEVIECDQPTRQVHRSTSIPVLKPLDIVMELQRSGEARTDLELGWRGSSALGPIGAGLLKVLRSDLERDIAITADNMREAIEAEARGGS